MHDLDRLRVALMIGNLPADVRRLETASCDMELTVHRSQWKPPQIITRASVPHLRAQNFGSIIWSRRGHLTSAYCGLCQALTDENPDVVHVLSESWDLLAVEAAVWTRAHPETRLVIHGCDTRWDHGGTVEQWFRRSLLRRALPCTHAWVAESGRALVLAACNGLPESSMRVRIPTSPRDGELFRLPAQAERTRARAALEVAPDSVAVGLLGSLEPEKGVRLFLDTAESLLRDRFSGHFFVVSDGSLRDEVRYRTSYRVVLLDTLPHPTGVLQLFQALDVLACLSLTTPSWEDQGSRPLLEAMMCGCIPVGTPTGAIPEMLGGHGALAESTEPPAVADAIAGAAPMSRDSVQRTQLASWTHSFYAVDVVAAQPAARPGRKLTT